MRVTVLTTRTNNTPAFYEPLHCIARVSVVVYDLMAREHMDMLPYVVGQNRPDWVLMIGAHEDYHDWPVPTVEVLAEIGERWPLVHMCCDGAEPVWWSQIQRYYDRGRFALQINIDGTRTGPIGDRGITLLSPFDPSHFPSPPRPWSDRPIRLGFAGSRGDPSHPRGKYVQMLETAGLLTVRNRDSNGHADGYRDFLSSCRCVWNAPWTGSGDTMHVKGRPLEAAHAGAVLFEHAQSPLSDWFTPGQDYLPYSDLDDVMRGLEWVDRDPVGAEAMATRLRERVVDEHSPAAFWERVLERLGRGSASRPFVQPPLRPYTVPAARPLLSASVTEPMPPEAPLAAMVGLGDQPVLLDVQGTVNYVGYRGRVYAVPQRLGTICLELPADRSRTGVVAFATLAEAKRAIVT